MNSERFILKEIENRDIKLIHRGLSDERVTKHYAVHFPTLEDAQEQMDWYADLKNNGTGLWWGIYSLETGDFCGAGGFNDLDRDHKKAEIGFWLYPEFWGKGIMKEVMPLLFQKGFETLDLNRIEGFVESDNSKCKAALEKINFHYEGTLRECEIKDGKYLDVDIYALLKKDWQNKKGCLKSCKTLF